MEATPENIRKAAILVANLDREAADDLLAQLPEQQAQLVRNMVVALDEIDADEQERVLAEFLERRSQPARQNASGVELELRYAEPPADEGPDQPAGEAGTQPRPFEFLSGADSRRLVRLLEHEHPQTMAVVLAHLSREQAAAVITALETSMQSEVLRRLAFLEETDPECLLAIEEHIKGWFDNEPRQHRHWNTGLDAVAEILGAVDTDAQSALVASLRQRDGRLAAELTKKLPRGSTAALRVSQPTASGLESLPRPGSQWNPQSGSTAMPSPWLPAPSSLPSMSTGVVSVNPSLAELDELQPEEIKAVIRACDPEVLMLALAAVPPETVNRFLQPFPPREAEALRRALDHLGPTRLSDVEAAQVQLVELARRLQQEGRIGRNLRRLSVAA